MEKGSPDGVIIADKTKRPTTAWRLYSRKKDLFIKPKHDNTHAKRGISNTIPITITNITKLPIYEDKSI